MKSWAHDEMLSLDLGDERLNKRCVTLLEAVAALPEASLPVALTSEAATKAAYRFLKNDHFQTASIVAAHRQKTVQRCHGHAHVLALHDTTTLNYSSHLHTQGLGYLGEQHCQGVFVHSVLMCSDTGVPLGVGYQDVWARSNAEVGKKKHRKTNPIETKESYKWLKALYSVIETFPDIPEVTVISDQESDLFEYFFVTRPTHIQVLLRARYNRSTPEGKVFALLQSSPEAGTLTVQVPRKDNQVARMAQLAIRFAPVEVLPPQQHPRRKEMAPVHLYAVLAQEVSDPPVGSKRIQWFLLTTHEVRSFEEACEMVNLYSQRWLIERYHYVLKSGCHMEALQLSTRERLERALSLYCVAAWRLLWMTYLARKVPKASCEEVFEPYEWQALHGFVKPREALPKKPPTIYVVVRWIAQLGGFLNRKGDGEPGVKAIWTGLAKFKMISQTWLKLQQNPHLLKPSGDVGNA